MSNFNFELPKSSKAEKRLLPKFVEPEAKKSSDRGSSIFGQIRDKMFENLDANHDGKISKEEWNRGNMDPKDKKIADLQDEVARLKKQLEGQKNRKSSGNNSSSKSNGKHTDNSASASGTNSTDNAKNAGSAKNADSTKTEKRKAIIKNEINKAKESIESLKRDLNNEEKKLESKKQELENSHWWQYSKKKSLKGDIRCSEKNVQNYKKLLQGAYEYLAKKSEELASLS